MIDLIKLKPEIERVCRLFPIKRLGLLGSALTQECELGSDVDVLVVFDSDESIDFFDKYNGFLPPDEFLPQLQFGLGFMLLEKQDYKGASVRLKSVVDNYSQKGVFCKGLIISQLLPYLFILHYAGQLTSFSAIFLCLFRFAPLILPQF